MFAVFESGGRQYKVRVGDEIRVEKLSGEANDVVTFDKVLLLAKDGSLTTGKPFVAGGAVKAQVVRQAKDKKIIVFKHKQRKQYNRRKGHRQPFTAIRITEIVAGA